MCPVIVIASLISVLPPGFTSTGSNYCHWNLKTLIYYTMPPTCACSLHGTGNTGASRSSGLSYQYIAWFLGEMNIIQALFLRTYVSITFPVAVIRYHDKNNLRKIGFILVHSPKVLSIMTRKTWQQELEGTGLVAFAGRKQRCCSIPTQFCSCLRGPRITYNTLY